MSDLEPGVYIKVGTGAEVWTRLPIGQVYANNVFAACWPDGQSDLNHDKTYLADAVALAEMSKPGWVRIDDLQLPAEPAGISS